MANNTQRLTASGTLGSIQAGGSRTVTPGLTDGQNSLDINQVIVSNGLTFTINNVVDPSTVTFFNPTQNAIDGAFYKITHDHSIQTQYPTPTATTVGADTAPTPDNASGALEMSLNATDAFGAGTNTIIFDDAVQSGSVGAILAEDLGTGRIVIQPVTATRHLLMSVKVTLDDDAAEAVTLELVRDPDGAATVVATAITTVPVVADTVTVNLQALIGSAPAAALGDRTYELQITNGGNINIAPGNLPRGASWIVSTL
jgi:hypothetical protein